jgi:hypothetical protein
MDRKSVHAVIEIINQLGEKAEGGLKTARAIAASEAFRKYNWIKNAPVHNVSGNLRGMVISKRWAVVFDFAESSLKVVEKVAILAALAQNIAAAHHNFDTVIQSSDRWDSKAARISTQVSSVMIRTVAGSIPAGAELLSTSISGYCQMAELAGVSGANTLDRNLRGLNARFKSQFDKVTDGDNVNLFIQKHLVIR